MDEERGKEEEKEGKREREKERKRERVGVQAGGMKARQTNSISFSCDWLTGQLKMAEQKQVRGVCDTAIEPM